MKKLIVSLSVCLMFFLVSCANPTSNPKVEMETETKTKITELNGSFKMEENIGSEKNIGIFTFNDPMFSLEKISSEGMSIIDKGYYRIENEIVHLFKDDGCTMKYCFLEGIYEFNITEHGNAIEATSPYNSYNFKFIKQ